MSDECETLSQYAVRKTARLHHINSASHSHSEHGSQVGSVACETRLSGSHVVYDTNCFMCLRDMRHEYLRRRNRRQSMSQWAKRGRECDE